MDLHEAISCYRIKHDTGTGAWVLDPDFTSSVRDLYIPVTSGASVYVRVRMASPVDALAEGYDAIRIFLASEHE